MEFRQENVALAFVSAFICPLVPYCFIGVLRGFAFTMWCFCFFVLGFEVVDCPYVL